MSLPRRLLFAPLALAAPVFGQLPEIDSVTPSFAQFPSVITITGQNLAGATAVSFGAIPGTVIGSDDTRVIATVGPIAPGFADVSITTPAGIGSALDGAEFLPNLELSGGTELGGPLGLTLRNGAGGVAILGYSFDTTAPLPVTPWHFGLELDLAQGFGSLGNLPIPASGTASLAIEFPVVPALLGREVFYQAFSTLEPAGFLIGGSFSDTESALVTGVAFDPPSNLAYAAALAQYPLGFEIEPNLPQLDSFADAWSIAPALPAGLVLDPVSGAISGTPQALSPLTPYTVTAANAAGSTSATLQLGVVPPVNGLLDPNSGGLASELRIAEIRYGRSVDVYSRPTPDAIPELVYPDLVIGQSVVGASGLSILDRSEATGRERYIVLAPNTPQQGEPFDFIVQAAVERAELLTPQAALELAQGFVPRNACFSVRFDDLVDPDTFDFNVNFRLMIETIHDPVDSNLWPRTRFSPNWGGYSALDGSFQSTRLIVDLTFDPLERFLGFATTILPFSGAGIPPFEDSPDFANNLTDVALRFATQADPAGGVFQVISNLSGAGLTAADNGPIDAGSTTLDAIRAFRAGQPVDPSRGFLADSTPPRPQLQLDAQLTRLAPDPAGLAELDYTADLSFLDDACFLAPQVGDGLRAVGAFQRLYTVTSPGTVVGTSVVGVGLRREPQLSFDVTGTTEDARLVRTIASLPAGLDPACLVRDAIAPFGAPVGVLQPSAIPLVCFDEALYEPDAKGYDGLQLFREAQVTNPTDVVPTSVHADLSFRNLLAQPLLQLAHANNAEDYFLSVGQASTKRLRDLAGNPLLGPGFLIPLSVDPAAPAVDNGGWVLRFDQLDEGGPTGSEVSGNFAYDLPEGRLRPRPVERFSAVLDATSPSIGAMQSLPVGLATPLSGLGSRLHHVWRSFDMGLPDGQRATGFEDIDVEALALALPTGSVAPEFYPEFEILAGHSRRLPDEVLDPFSALPALPASGFFSSSPFADNYLTDAQLLHERSLGFAVSSLDVFQATTGTPMLRLPLNQDVEPGAEQRFTWRDTAIRQRGALGGLGGQVPLAQEVAVLGLGSEPGEVWGGPSATPRVPAGVPTVGLPLLLEYRCFPSDAISLNRFSASLATVSSNQPFFRAFSTGGFDLSGAAVVKDPDLELFPSGGFNGDPALGPLGAPTPPRDSVVYQGQVDFVVRISRVVTALQTAVGFSDPDYRHVSLDADGLVGDAEVLLAFRGHDLTLPSSQPADDASQLDVYGDLITGPLLANQPTLYPPLAFTTPDWSDSIEALDGTDLLQVRLTFVSDLASGVAPTVSALGVAYE